MTEGRQIIVILDRIAHLVWIVETDRGNGFEESLKYDGRFMINSTGRKNLAWRAAMLKGDLDEKSEGSEPFSGSLEPLFGMELEEGLQIERTAIEGAKPHELHQVAADEHSELYCILKKKAVIRIESSEVRNVNGLLDTHRRT